jgi:hypothetical protein
VDAFGTWAVISAIDYYIADISETYQDFPLASTIIPVMLPVRGGGVAVATLRAIPAHPVTTDAISNKLHVCHRSLPLIIVCSFDLFCPQPFYVVPV